MLNTNERNYLLNSMQELLVEYDYEYSVSALEDIIDEWTRQKWELIQAFKKHPNYIEGKFMIAFSADYERTVNKVASRAFRDWLRYDVMAPMKHNLPKEISENLDPWEYLPMGIYNFFYYLENYASRTVSESTAEYLNSCVPSLHVHVGQKTSRVVNKLCNYLGYDKADGYNREFAKYADSLSPMVIKRHTVLSINPLDYLTMSFGNSWASCHTIDKENKRNMPNNYSGCYSSGTVSYMLDSTSMVLYTVDASYDGDEYWTQPKINRQMFHYGEDKLVQARLYPQDNDGNGDAYVPYRNIVQQIMSIIFEFPNLWVLKKDNYPATSCVRSWGTHYRDYECYRNCNVSYIKGSENKNYMSVGADPICIECGERHSEAENINHCRNGHRCANCGEWIDREDEIWVDDECYCRDCVSYCDRCGEYHREEGTYIPSEDRYVCDSCLSAWYVYCDSCDEYVHENNMVWIECECRYVCDDCADRYYTCCEDCGEYFPNDDIREYDDYLMLCNDCYNERIAQDQEDDDEDEDEE